MMQPIITFEKEEKKTQFTGNSLKRHLRLESNANVAPIEPQNEKPNLEGHYVVSVPHFEHWHASNGALGVVFRVAVHLNS